MKILINHGQLTTELTSTPNETWGGFTQRFVEHSLLHPPQLLQLLVNILNYSNDSNSGGGVISECSYRLRYGDGYGTLIKPTWNATGSVVAGEDDGNSIIEANITLKPKSGSSNNFSGLVIDDESEQIEVDLYVEKIGLSSSKNGKQKKKKKSTANTEGGSVLFGNMTQTPFPINVKRVHVLHVVEHSLFKGVIDSYSLSKPDDEGDISNGGVGETISKSVSGKKRKENPVVTATETSSGGAKKGRSEETTSDAKSTSVTASSILQKAHDLAASMKEKDAQGASSSSSSKKKQTIANDGEEKVANDTIDDSAAKKKKSAATPKKNTADDAATEQSPKKSTAGKSSEKKKKKKSTKKKKADDVDVAEEATDKSPAKKKARKSTGGDDDDNEKDGKEAATPRPKRPLNAYQRFANDMRPKIVKDNPDIKFGEVVSVCCMNQFILL